MVNEGLVKRLLRNLESHLADLRECRSIPLGEFQGNKKTQRYAERTLHIAIETVLDIAHHVISDEQLREPTSYADAFMVLAEAEVLTVELSERCRGMAQFRNLLVHAYERIDPVQTCAIIQRNLPDFEDFARQISTWLKEKKEEAEVS
jgi:uncharacterized protein YutE (UPF0331/DUF86 family)